MIRSRIYYIRTISSIATIIQMCTIHAAPPRISVQINSSLSLYFCSGVVIIKELYLILDAVLFELPGPNLRLPARPDGRSLLDEFVCQRPVRPLQIDVAIYRAFVPLFVLRCTLQGPAVSRALRPFQTVDAFGISCLISFLLGCQLLQAVDAVSLDRVATELHLQPCAYLVLEFLYRFEAVDRQCGAHSSVVTPRAVLQAPVADPGPLALLDRAVLLAPLSAGGGTAVHLSPGVHFTARRSQGVATVAFHLVLMVLSTTSRAGSFHGGGIADIIQVLPA